MQEGSPLLFPCCLHRVSPAPDGLGAPRARRRQPSRARGAQPPERAAEMGRAWPAASALPQPRLCTTGFASLSSQLGGVCDGRGYRLPQTPPRAVGGQQGRAFCAFWGQVNDGEPLRAPGEARRSFRQHPHASGESCACVHRRLADARWCPIRCRTTSPPPPPPLPLSALHSFLATPSLAWGGNKAASCGFCPPV